MKWTASRELQNGKFYRMKNQEQGREKWKIFDWPGSHSLVWGEKEQESKYRAQSSSCLGLADWIESISGQAEHLLGYASCLSLGLLMWHHGQE